MVVVADTSVLLNLCRVQLDWLLPRIFGEVWIPPMVEQEFYRLAMAHPRFLGLVAGLGETVRFCQHPA